MVLGVFLAAPARSAPSEPTVEDLRAVVAEQQRAIDSLQATVDELAAERTATGTQDAGDGDRFYNLEQRVSKLDALLGDLDIGGWLDFRYADSSRDGQDAYFDAHHLYLYFDAQVSDRWRAFAELEFEHSPQFDGGGGSGEIKLERLYAQYNHSELLNVRFGKFATQVGYWTPIHWAILVDTIQKPIHEDNQYVPRKQVGVELFGNLYDGHLAETPLRLDYYSWLSNGTEIFGTNEPQDNDMGYGFDVRATFAELYMFGLSGYQQENPARLGRTERSVMLYTDLRLPHALTLRGEYLHQSRSRGFDDIDVAYVKLRYDFLERWYVNYRFGIGDDEKRGAGDTHIENVLTLGYSPHTNVRLKVEWAHNSFDARAIEDFSTWGAFIGVFF